MAIMCICIHYGFTHDTNQAFFKITQKNDVVEVKAEFPWTIRKAFIKAFPEFSTSKNKEAFDAAFFEYIKQNFIVGSDAGDLKLLSVAKGLADGHSHQNNYVFNFRGSVFNTITNTVMCNLSPLHENHHQLKFEGALQEYVTSNSSPNFILGGKKLTEDSIESDSSLVRSQRDEEHSHTTDTHVHPDHKQYYYYYVSVFIAIVLLLFVYYFRRNKKYF